MPAASWPSRNGKSSLIAALAVVEVGVADPAGLMATTASPGPGIGDDDRLDADRLALGASDDAAYFLTHGSDGIAPTGVQGTGWGSRDVERP